MWVALRCPGGRDPEVPAEMPFEIPIRHNEQRLAAATRLFEGAAKTLAQAPKLLRPKASVVNIAQQQIVNM